MKRARFSTASSSPGCILGPQKALEPEWRHDISMWIRSCVIFPFESSILNTLCRKIVWTSYKIQNIGYDKFRCLHKSLRGNPLRNGGGGARRPA